METDEEKQQYWKSCFERMKSSPKEHIVIDVIRNEGNVNFTNLDELLNFVRNNSFNFALIKWTFPGDETWGLANTDLNPVMLESFDDYKEVKDFLENELNKKAARTFFRQKYPNA